MEFRPMFSRKRPETEDRKMSDGSDDLGIPMTTIRPGSTATILVTPKKAGTYVLRCQMFCGPGHADMTITVTVV